MDPTTIAVIALMLGFGLWFLGMRSAGSSRFRQIASEVLVHVGFLIGCLAIGYLLSSAIKWWATGEP